MTNLGHIQYSLGIEVTQNPKYIFISQNKYIAKFLNKFDMVECNPLSTPMEQNLKLTSKEMNEFEDATKYKQLVGGIIYLTTTRTDIPLIVGILSRFMKKHCEGHWFATKRVLKHLKGTQDFGLKYSKVDDFNLIGYSDSNFVGNKENGLSTSSYLISLGPTTISWRSESIPADSTIEAEYVVVAEATKKIVWLKKILEYLQEKHVSSTLLVDNTSTIMLAKNPRFHYRTKHISIVSRDSISCRGQDYSFKTLFHK
jgi:hypothetical protein